MRVIEELFFRYFCPEKLKLFYYLNFNFNWSCVSLVIIHVSKSQGHPHILLYSHFLFALSRFLNFYQLLLSCFDSLGDICWNLSLRACIISLASVESAEVVGQRIKYEEDSKTSWKSLHKWVSLSNNLGGEPVVDCDCWTAMDDHETIPRLTKINSLIRSKISFSTLW